LAARLQLKVARHLKQGVINMFAKFALSFVSFLIVSQPAFATHRKPLTPERLCKREFAHDLFKCVVTNFRQKPKVRGEKIRTCVDAAKTEKQKCLANIGGPSQCELSCQASYDANVLTCQATFDPSVCGGNLACETFFQQERSACISLEVDTLNACTAACPQ